MDWFGDFGWHCDGSYYRAEQDFLKSRLECHRPTRRVNEHRKQKSASNYRKLAQG